MKIIIEEIFPEFKGLHPDCEEVTWDKDNGVLMILIGKWGRRSINQKDIPENLPTYKLFTKAQNLVDDFLGQQIDNRSIESIKIYK